jgi:hypothetical protein
VANSWWRMVVLAVMAAMLTACRGESSGSSTDPPDAADRPPGTAVQQSAAGLAALSWTAPEQNSDGSPSSGLAGYRIYHGTGPEALNEMTQVPGAASTHYTFSQLPRGTHYFAVAAYTVEGLEGALSTIRSKVVP